MLISVVVPVYNSASTLEALVERVHQVFAGLPEHEHELILVDDGSPDPAVWPLLESLAKRRAEVVAIQLSRNFGQHPATLCGLRHSRGEAVVTLDDDLQQAPEDIPALLEAADHDIVIGQLRRKNHPPLRRLMSRVKGYFDRVLIGKPKNVQLSSFRLLNRTVVDGVLTIRTPHPFLPALMFYVSRDVVGVPVSHQPRTEGRSGYTPRKLIRLFSNLIVNNSSLVLRWVGYAGMVSSVFSFLAALWVVVRKLFYDVAIPGWASILVTLLFLGGLLLFALGVIGEYLVRIVETSESKPTYFVRRRLGRSDEAVVSAATPRDEVRWGSHVV